MIMPFYDSHGIQMAGTTTLTEAMKKGKTLISELIIKAMKRVN